MGLKKEEPVTSEVIGSMVGTTKLIKINDTSYKRDSLISTSIDNTIDDQISLGNAIYSDNHSIFYLPENLNLDLLIKVNPPLFKPFKIDKAMYIIHLITEIPILNKGLLKSQFIPVNSKGLQKVIKNCKQYLTYLEKDLRVIESDRHYVVGHKSIGYKISSKYNKRSKEVSITDFTLIRSLNNIKKERIRSVRNCQHLTKSFNSRLNIDYEKAVLFLEKEYIIKKKHEKFEMIIGPDGPMKDILMKKYNAAIISIGKIKKGNYHLSRDNNVRRFHSNLTNMKSILRNALSYDGQKLISLDLKNSQPYLSTVLLNEKFWKEGNMFLDKTSEYLIKYNAILIKDLSYNYSKYLLPFISQTSFIMLGEIAAAPLNKGFERYIELVTSGKFYEYLEDQFSTLLGLNFVDRKEVKSAVFQVLFTDNRFIGQNEAKPKRIFKHLFPEVYNIFSILKRKDKTDFPILLQRIESFLIIDVISKRISYEYPNAPIFTIHDSIATTEQYFDRVKQIMIEELTRAIGYPPILQRENWDPKNMDMYLLSLNKKLIGVA